MFQLLSLVILSRLLSAVDYGLMAMANVVINLAYIFRDLGATSTLIQRRQLTLSLINSAFVVNLVIGLFTFAVICLFARIVGTFFNEPKLSNLLCVIALAFPLNSLNAVPSALLERAHEFKKLAKFEFIAGLIGLIFAILAGLLGCGAYSFAIQLLASTVVTFAMLLNNRHWIPRLSCNSADVRSIWKFGGYLFGFSLVNYAGRNADGLLVGKFLGTAKLGVYGQAYRIMLLPVQSLTFVANRALFPVLSRQEKGDRSAGELYLRSLRAVATVSAPLTAWVWCFRESLITILLGPHWIEAAQILLFLAPVGFIQSMVSSTGAVFMAAGKTRTMMWLGVVGTLLQVTGFSIGLMWGTPGLAAGYLVASCINAIPCFYFTCAELNVKPRTLIRYIRRPIGITAVTLLVTWEIQNLMEGISEMAIVPIGLSIGALSIYCALMHFFAKDELLDLQRLLMPGRLNLGEK